MARMTSSMMAAIVTLVAIVTMAAVMATRISWRELQLALVGFPADVRRRIADQVSARTVFTLRSSKHEPKQDMTSSQFLNYHTELDWRRLQDATTTDMKIAVFNARAARIGLVNPADGYLRKVRARSRVHACARVRAREVCAAVSISSGFDDVAQWRDVVLRARGQWGRMRKTFIREGFAASANHRHYQHHPRRRRQSRDASCCSVIRAMR